MSLNIKRLISVFLFIGFLASFIYISNSNANAESTYSGLTVDLQSNKRSYNRSSYNKRKKQTYRDERGFLVEGIKPLDKTISQKKLKGKKEADSGSEDISSEDADKYLDTMSDEKKRKYRNQSYKSQMDNLYGN